ncbi:MAG: hypothetical protein PHO15_00310 [Eubacteriales bacterium]|nr:hypothetical protein [Eubacteriales bacterium]
MATGHMRGHAIYFDETAGVWKYSDTGAQADDSRPCKRCGRYPTKEGYDACLGYIEGVTSACCGHGVHGRIEVKEI